MSKKIKFLILQAARTCREETGVNPLRIYCSITGRPIGSLDESILFDIYAESGEQDIDALADDLLVRTLCSARPSPSWNIVDRQSLKLYVKTRPAETLTYLLSRLYEPGQSLKVSFDSRLRHYHQRIQLHNIISRVLETGIDLSELMFMLVNIDGLYNLNSLPIPRNDIILTLTLAAEAHEKGEADAIESFMAEWHEWHNRLEGAWLKRQKAALTQDAWLKGNSLAGSARTNLILDRKPVSEATQKKRAKDQMEGDLLMMLRTIMHEAEKEPESTMAAAAEAKPVKGLIRPGQLKFVAPKAREAA